MSLQLHIRSMLARVGQPMIVRGQLYGSVGDDGKVSGSTVVDTLVYGTIMPVATERIDGKTVLEDDVDIAVGASDMTSAPMPGETIGVPDFDTDIYQIVGVVTVRRNGVAIEHRCHSRGA